MEIIPQRDSILHEDRKQLENYDEVIGAAFHRGPSRRSGYKLTGWILASAITDLVVIVVCTLLFVVGSSLLFKAVNNSELNQFMNSLLNRKALNETLFFIFTYISIIYFVFLRIFLGSTVGEWSCGLRVGQPSERMKASYAFKIIFRVLLITLTGVITIPLLSLIFKKDIAGYLTRASLYTLK